MITQERGNIHNFLSACPLLQRFSEYSDFRTKRGQAPFIVIFSKKWSNLHFCDTLYPSS